MRQIPISIDPIFTTLHHSTFLYINNEIVDTKLNKKDFKIKTEYLLNNKLINRNIKSSSGDSVKLESLSYPKCSKSNLLKVTTSATTTTTTTTTTNRITSSTVSKIKPTKVSPRKNYEKEIKVTMQSENIGKERNFQNEKRYAEYGRDINEKFIANIQKIDLRQIKNVSIFVILIS